VPDRAEAFLGIVQPIPTTAIQQKAWSVYFYSTIRKNSHLKKVSFAPSSLAFVTSYEEVFLVMSSLLFLSPKNWKTKQKSLA
jgi:hypothetical protein